MLLPMSVAAASASTRSRGLATAHGEPKQLMDGEYLILNGKTRRLVAEQLRDQRQIEPLARLRGAVDQLADQRSP